MKDGKSFMKYMIYIYKKREIWSFKKVLIQKLGYIALNEIVDSFYLFFFLSLFFIKKNNTLYVIKKEV